MCSWALQETGWFNDPDRIGRYTGTPAHPIVAVLDAELETR